MKQEQAKESKLRVALTEQYGAAGVVLHVLRQLHAYATWTVMQTRTSEASSSPSL